MDRREARDSLRDKDQQLATLQALQTSRTYVIRTADGALPDRSDPTKNAMIGLMLGLVLGLGLAFAIEALDTRVRSATRSAIGSACRCWRGSRRRRKRSRRMTSSSCWRSQRERTPRHSGCCARTSISRCSSTTARGRYWSRARSSRRASRRPRRTWPIAEARAGRRVALVDLDLRIPYLDRFFGLMHAAGHHRRRAREHRARASRTADRSRHGGSAPTPRGIHIRHRTATPPTRASSTCSSQAHAHPIRESSSAAGAWARSFAGCTRRTTSSSSTRRRFCGSATR